MPSARCIAVAAVAASLPLASSYAVSAPSSSATAAAVAAAARCPQPLAIADLIKPSLAVLGGGAPEQNLGEQLPDCPGTIWEAEDLTGDNIDKWQAKYKSEDMPVCPIEIHATPEDNAKGADYFIENREMLTETLAKHGTIWFRGFDLTKDTNGFREFWESLQLPPCLDPIHSSGLRKFLSKKDALYEEVNKQSLAKHFIGLHNEATFKKTATTGAFVCFQPATEWGGEFFIADGERIFRDMDADVLKKLCERKVRISVSNLDLDFLDLLPGATKEEAMDKVADMVGESVAPKFDMDLDMIWGTDGRDMRLQAVEHAQMPVNRQPANGRPVWFCNMHNHARFLRERRPCSVPEVGMTDVYYGNLDIIEGELLAHVNEVCEKNIVRVPMQPGDILLCDNYRVLHGRDIFEGDRLHAVSWFGDEETRKAESAAGKTAATSDGIAGFMNKFVVGD